MAGSLDYKELNSPVFPVLDIIIKVDLSPGHNGVSHLVAEAMFSL